MCENNFLILLFFSGMIKLTAGTGTKFIKRNVLHYINVNFIKKIKTTDKKRKEPQFLIAEARKRVMQSFNPSELHLIPFIIWTSLKRSLNLGRLIVEFFLICTISKVHKLKVCWFCSLPLFSGVLSMEYEMDWAEIRAKKFDLLKKNIWK